MTSTFTAVYRGGAFHPTNPPELADGATVTLTMAADPDQPPTGKSPGEQAYEIIRAIVSRHGGKADPVGDGLTVSESVDKVLYSNPHGDG